MSVGSGCWCGKARIESDCPVHGTESLPPADPPTEPETDLETRIDRWRQLPYRAGVAPAPPTEPETA